MLEELLRTYSSWVKCPNDAYKLTSVELPTSFYGTDTCFAIYCKTAWRGDSALVLFENGEAGLECKIGKSLWYLLENVGLVNSHKLDLEIRYKIAGEQGTWTEYDVKM